MAPKVLVVLTSFGHIEAANKPTGWYLPELSHPYDVLTQAGIEIVTASPKGGVAPLDPASVEAFKDDAGAQAFAANKKSVWEQTQTLSSFKGRSGEFAALFYPGGHGPMFDLVDDADSIAVIEEFAAAEKPVAAVCHGPVVFLNAKSKDGKSILAGKDATGFSNAEEDAAGMTQYMPFLLEDRMKAVGANYKKADKPWAEFVLVQDGGKFITGQNPASAKGVGEAILKVIGA
ncbi:ThiJ/PfpI family protein [Xylariaceae sp. AK1471]|nr:ThiJ/PfpI family protein [Xylariaceae sp. AK1471]